MTEKITTKSIFAIELYRLKSGAVYLRDLQENIYEVRHKDNTLLTEADYNSIIENQLGFWSIAKRFNLIVSNKQVLDE